MEYYAIQGSYAGPIFLYTSPGATPDGTILVGCDGPLPAGKLILPVPRAGNGEPVWLSSGFTGGAFQAELAALCRRFPAVYLSLDPLSVRFCPPGHCAEPIPAAAWHAPDFFSEALQCRYASYLENGQLCIELHDTPETLRQKAKIAAEAGVTALLYRPEVWTPETETGSPQKREA